MWCMRQKAMFTKLREVLGKRRADGPTLVSQYEAGSWRVAVDEDSKVLLRLGQQVIGSDVEGVKPLVRLLVRLYPEWIEDMLGEVDADLLEVETEKAMAVAEKTGLIGVEEERTRKVRRES